VISPLPLGGQEAKPAFGPASVFLESRRAFQ
jgi:hypothetical protein